jgi:glycerol-3-phosphate acyltransferase PlsX
VTDGFSGNVVLKALEGALSSIMAAVERALTATDELAAHFEPIRPALEDLYERLEPESFGEAMLLGVDGVCIISHGSSSAKEPQRHQDGAGDGGRGGRRGGAGAVSAG